LYISWIFTKLFSKEFWANPRNISTNRKVLLFEKKSFEGLIDFGTKNQRLILVQVRA
jgi:hypothetical protein